MKKMIPALLVLLLVFSLASCKDNKNENTNDNSSLVTAETVYNVTNEGGGVAINESVAKRMLGEFSKELLGLDKSIDAYKLELSSTRLNEKDACLVKAFDGESETPSGVFAIIGYDCYVFSKKDNSFLLLTADSTVKVSGMESTEGVSSPSMENTSESFSYDKENNEKLHKQFDSYTPEQLGFQKKPSEYIMIMAGTTTTAQDGKTVYVVRMYEKNGNATNYTVAFNGDGNYSFNTDIRKYVEIK